MKLFLTVFLFCSTVFAQGNQIYIKLGDAKTKKSMLAIAPLQYFGSPTGSFQAVGSELYNTITNDLDVSSYFQIMSPKGFVETGSPGIKPFPTDPKGFRFESWNAIKAEFLIRGGYSVAGNDVSLEIYVYHVPQNKLLFGKKYNGSANIIRKVAHAFANDMLKELTGKEGPFLSKMVVSSDRNVAPAKEIFMMDWDGANPKRISEHRSISLSPAWSFDGKKVAYTAFVQKSRSKQRNADLYLYDVETQSRRALSTKSGMNSGASFHPDNRHVYLTVSQGGTPDIFKLNLDGSVVSQVTKGPFGAMNVEPNISLDGSKIAFSSDRAGKPMVYVMNSDGSSAKRLTMVGQFNSSPSFSPDGSKIAFAGQVGNNFDIYVMDSNGGNMIKITSANRPNGRPANNEDPSFSPDGRFIMFTSDRTGKNQVYIATADGTEERRITQDRNNYYKPRWSQNLN
ncbi:MAG: translocation protein TolB [Bdellovibrionota bacterium]